MREIRGRSGVAWRLDGFHQLRCPWTEQSMVRVGLGPQQRVLWHLFGGDSGVTLALDAGGRRITAYRTTRAPNAKRPQSYVLAADDGGRWRRTSRVSSLVLSMRFLEHELIVGHGDVELLRVAMAAVPEEVYVEGRLQVEGIEWLRYTKPLTGRKRGSQSLRSLTQRPSDLHWSLQIPDGAEFARINESMVRLSANQAAKPAWITTPLLLNGPSEVLVELDEVSAGTGLFLAADASDQPRQVIRFLSNRRADGNRGAAQTCASIGYGATDVSPLTWGPINRKDIPSIGRHTWVRILVGAGVTRWWVGTDGVHWAEPDRPMSMAKAKATRLGLFVNSRNGPAGMTVRQLIVRPLPAFAALLPPDLAPLAVDAVGGPDDLDEWSRQIEARRPPDRSATDWWLATAAVVLGQGCSEELGLRLVNDLVARLGDPSIPLDDRFDLLDEAVLLTSGRLPKGEVRTYVDRYFQLAQADWAVTGNGPLSTIRLRMMEAEFGRSQSIYWERYPAARTELLQLLYTDQWQSLRRELRMRRFFHLSDTDPLTVWLDRLSSGRLRERDLFRGVSIQPVVWRHPWSDDFSREVYNVIAEFDAMLRGNTWDEAAAIVMDSEKMSRSGIAPAPGESNLFVSVPAMVRMAKEDHPELIRSLDKVQGPLAKLRIGRAIEQGNLEQVKQMAEQLYGTEAAESAWTWFGDQELARGRWQKALDLYQQAARGRPVESSPDLAGRMLIASAYGGRKLELTVDNEVHFGETTMTPEELLRTVSQLIARERPTESDPERIPDRDKSPDALPRFEVTRPIELVRREPLDLRSIDYTKVRVPPPYDRACDWYGLQVTGVLVDNVLCVGDRFSWKAIGPNKNGIAWKSSWTTPQPKELSWPAIGMRPLVVRQRLITRRLVRDAPHLICLNVTDGKIAWTSDGAKQPFVSDPYWFDEQLVCVSSDPREAVDGMLRLNYLDVDTGQISRSVPLVRLRDSWWDRRCCQVLSAGDRLFITLGGVTLAVRSDGRLQWVRSSTALPPAVDERLARQRHAPPLLTGTRLIVTQPGVPTVECLDAVTGRLHWQTVIPDILRLVSVDEQRVLVLTDGGIVAQDLADGRRVWQRDFHDVRSAFATEGERAVVVIDRIPVAGKGKLHQITFHWLDGGTGAITRSAEIEELSSTAPVCRPLSITASRWDFLWGDDTKPGERQVLTIRPVLP